MIPGKPATIDEYIAAFPEPVQTRLQQVRTAIRKAAPEAQETIAYAMPAFTRHGPLVYFAGYQKHIGFYPMLSALAAFAGELASYPRSKGAVQFPMNQPLPLALIRKMVRYRVQENEAKATAKKPAKAAAAIAEGLPAPAARALQGARIRTLQQLAAQTEEAVAALHGIGPNAIDRLKQALQAAGLAFKKTTVAARVRSPEERPPCDIR